MFGIDFVAFAPDKGSYGFIKGVLTLGLVSFLSRYVYVPCKELMLRI